MHERDTSLPRRDGVQLWKADGDEEGGDAVETKRISKETKTSQLGQAILTRFNTLVRLG